MSKYDARIAKKAELLREISAQLKDLKAQEAKQRRKDETRRKVLYGSAFLLCLEEMTESKKRTALNMVHKHITTPRDRAFLDLAPLSDTETGSVRAATDDYPSLPFDFGGRVKSDPRP